jgi:hypothetical protein
MSLGTRGDLNMGRVPLQLLDLSATSSRWLRVGRLASLQRLEVTLHGRQAALPIRGGPLSILGGKNIRHAEDGWARAGENRPRRHRTRESAVKTGVGWANNHKTHPDDRGQYR